MLDVVMRAVQKLNCVNRLHNASSTVAGLVVVQLGMPVLYRHRYTWFVCRPNCTPGICKCMMMHVLLP
jgi:hypothetical protein